MDFKLNIDQEQFQKLVQDSIASRAVEMVSEHLPKKKLEEIVEVAIKNSTPWRNDSEFQRTLEYAIDYVITSTVQKAIEEAQIKSLIQTVANEYIASSEYQKALKKRVINAINQTTLHVHPGREDDR